jgi:hypothetical protein
MLVLDDCVLIDSHILQVLLPVILQVALFSSEGFQSGYFIGALDSDIVQTRGSKFTWPVSTRRMFFFPFRVLNQPSRTREHTFMYKR